MNFGTLHSINKQKLDHRNYLKDPVAEVTQIELISKFPREVAKNSNTATITRALLVTHKTARCVNVRRRTRSNSLMPVCQ